MAIRSNSRSAVDDESEIQQPNVESGFLIVHTISLLQFKPDGQLIELFRIDF
jgi:hypothetical protein